MKSSTPTAMLCTLLILITYTQNFLQSIGTPWIQPVGRQSPSCRESWQSWDLLPSSVYQLPSVLDLVHHLHLQLDYSHLHRQDLSDKKTTFQSPNQSFNYDIFLFDLYDWFIYIKVLPVTHIGFPLRPTDCKVVPSGHCSGLVTAQPPILSKGAYIMY